ncbi:MAG: molybdate ABC transporter substrate-binding protein [Magnetococcus sp. MYC-9]
MKTAPATLFFGLSLFVILSFATADEVQVAVAANFTAPMKIVAANFEKETGHRAMLAFGATGKFYAQIKNGAPFEILLAADQETPIRMEQDGLVVPGSRSTYAMGKLVLWSSMPDFVDDKGGVLKRGTFQHIALANPKVAPYGVAAWETLTRMGLQADLQAKCVQGENIAQTYQFVSTGNAELGFVALSQVYEDGRFKSGSGWVVPTDWYAPIRQDVALLTKGKGNPAARALMVFLESDKARSVIRSFGYDLK